ncbi:hypothetical protein ACQ86F_08845 [Streptomyces venezuelae ATCC 10712]
MTKDQTGRIIGASFGLVFIQAGAGSLPTAIAVPLRVLALAAFLRVAVFGRRGRTAGAPASTAPPRPCPGRARGSAGATGTSWRPRCSGSWPDSS